MSENETESTHGPLDGGADTQHGPADGGAEGGGATAALTVALTAARRWC